MQKRIISNYSVRSKKLQHNGEKDETSKIVIVNSSIKIVFNKLVVPTSSGFDCVAFNEIIYCSAEESYTRFYMNGNQQVITSRNIGEYDALLAAHDFFRVHESHLINLFRIKRYNNEDGGFVVMDDGKEISVSKRRKAEFLQLFLNR